MEKKIKHCKIDRGMWRNDVFVSYDDSGNYEKIGSYYPDELSFHEDEFIGLTSKQADDLMHQRDVAYLRR